MELEHPKILRNILLKWGSINHLIILLLFLSYAACKCDGFNWYHDIDVNECNKNDIMVLQDFIENSKTSINFEMDVNFNNKIDALELGWQLWENGKLIHWICNDVPSPFYLYNYDCGLSGNIPKSINQLDSIIKLHLQNNDLDGIIPNAICDLQISNSTEYWFRINDNKLCPPYPDCIKKLNTNQNNYKCD